MRVAETSAEFVVWWGNLRKTYHLEDLDVDGRIFFDRGHPVV
jgi:hypothetical protein